MRQEDVFWAGVVGPLGSGPGYDRPYLVVQNNAFNSSRISKVVVCGLTSNLRWGTGQRVALSGEADLPEQSVVNVSQIVQDGRSPLSASARYCAG